MGNYGEDETDGIGKCSCGCTEFIVETTSYVYVTRDKNLNYVSESKLEECDTKVTCVNCEKEVNRL